MTQSTRVSRRDVLKSAAATALGAGALPLLGQAAPAAARTERAMTQMHYTTVGGKDEIPTFQGLSNQFNRTHPNVKATFQLAPGSWEDFNRKLVTEIAGNSVPDAIRHAIIYRPELITAGYVVDLMPYAKRVNFNFDAYYKAPFNGYLTSRSLWGLPVGIYTMAMYYNKTMFKEAGIPLPPTDWSKGYNFEQFLDVAKKLTKGSGPNKQYGVVMNTDLRWWIQFIWQSGGDFLTPGYGKVALGQPGAQQALQYLHDMMFKYEVWPNPESLKTGPGPSGMFTSGRVGMYLEGNWQMPTMKTIKKFEWGVAPLPHNTHVYTGYYIDGWFVPKGVANPELSWELIASFLSPETERFIVRQSALGIPMHKKVAKDNAAILFNPLPPAEQKVWLDSPNYGHLFPYSPIYNQLDPIISRNMDLFALQQVTPKQFAANLSAQIDPLLAKLTPAQRQA